MAADPNDLTAPIQTAAQSPNSATADGVTTTVNTPSEMIEADKYPLAKRAAQGGPPWGIRIAAIVSPGAQ